MVTGYLHPQYAESLSEFGTPRELPRCGGWILERPIPGYSYRDAMGCYPIFACQDWTKLASDLDDIGDDLVSLVLVTDPFGEYDEACLHRCFDVVIPFKEHYIADLHRPINEIVPSRHHRRYIRKALESIHVEVSQEPIQHVDEWTSLYTALTNRHNVRGVRAFSRAAFLKQLSIPGTVIFRAIHQGTAIGAILTFEQGYVAYGHLMGTSDDGYKLGASYALYWSILQFMSGKVRWLDWGGVPGLKVNGSDGLSQFKRGWSTGTRIAYLCGRIFDQARYAALVNAKAISNTNYFPAYRNDEMG